MNEWKVFIIKDIGTILTGKTPSKNYPEDWGNNEMPFVTPTDYKYYRKKADFSERYLSSIGIDRLKNKVLPVGSVMVTCIGSDMGKVAINSLPVITNQQINSIIPNASLVDNDFLYYSLVSMYDTLRIYGGDGTAVPIVNKGDFENLEILLPPLPKQKAIAAVLSSLDDKIDLLHRQNKTLEALAETLFRQWFVEEAQDDWEEGTLGDLINISSGKGLRRKEYNENGNYPVLGANGLIGRTDKYLYDEKLIFTGRVGTLGNVFISEGKVWLSDNTLIIKPKSEDLFYLIYFFLKTAQLETFNVGSTQPLIRQSDINEIELKIPTPTKIKLFSQITLPFFDKIKKNKTQIHTLEKLRDTLLPKLMSGEVRVRL
ncbi:MAG: restriction endonuclease subunit S [Calditrichaeota bacterium]|nr:restriction endonuclease subunit S [Calditrichota bacterium]